MNGLTVLGQKADRNLQIQICNQIQIAFAIPVLPTQSNIPLKLPNLQV